jgi:ABC-type phosphate transport system substrate-binding protein
VGSVLCVALIASSAKAEDTATDPLLPSYRPVAGVVGVMGGHSTAAVSELMNAWGEDFERIYPGVRVGLDDASGSRSTRTRQIQSKRMAGRGRRRGSGDTSEVAHRPMDGYSPRRGRDGTRSSL